VAYIEYIVTTIYFTHFADETPVQIVNTLALCVVLQLVVRVQRVVSNFALASLKSPMPKAVAVWLL